jgi:sugar lactone lactonase YvrE
MRTSGATVLFDGLIFGEGPRWHDGKLWVTDQHAHKLWVIEPGDATVFAEFDDMPSGLGFLPDGTVLVAEMRTQKIWALSPAGDARELYADVSSHNQTPGLINDMVVDGLGRAYVGLRQGKYAQPTNTGPDGIVLIRPDRSTVLVDGDFRAPNGAIVTADNLTHICASTVGKELIAFDIEDDGTLTNRRQWAPVSSAVDGMCLDAENAMWIALPGEGRFERVLEGGDVVDAIEVDGWAIACVLGGPERRTLHMIVTDMSNEDITRFPDAGHDHDSRARGRVETVEVDVPGAGWP